MIATKPQEDERRSERIDPAVWRKLWRYTRPYKKTVVLFCVCAFGTAAVDVAFPLLTGRVIDAVAEHGRDAPLVDYAVAYAILTALLCSFIGAFIWLGGRIRTGVGHDIRRDGFENLQKLTFSYYDRRPVGWLMARMTSDCDRLSQILAWGVLDTVWGVTLMGGIAVVMLAVDIKLGLIVLTVIPLLAWLSGFFQKRILRSSRVVRKTNSRITAAYNEGIAGVRTAKVFVRENANLREFSGLTGEMQAASVRNQVQSALFLPLVLTLGSLATGLALVAGGLDVSVGRITIGTMIIFMSYTARFFEPIQELAYWFAELQMAQASAERILGLIEEEPEIGDSPAALAATQPAAEGRIRTIELAGVDFRYGDGPPVLEGFDLSVRAGQKIALVGSTGGGKSTIAGLLCRFYEPTAGEIRFDGVDYRRRRLSWLQSRLGIVLQTPHLFSGSVAENIRYGRLDATDHEVGAAARLVGAHEFIEALDAGYESEVGEGGNRLSTGQKQLVSFARAVLADPEILVLDEATSSIDTETERRIQSGLESVLEGRTSFVIAHRLSTIRSADLILVIEGGRIVEQGSHAELCARSGRYRELVEQQSLASLERAGELWSGACLDPT